MTRSDASAQKGNPWKSLFSEFCFTLVFLYFCLKIKQGEIADEEMVCSICQDAS